MSESLYTCAQIAGILGKSPVTVQKQARARGLGRKVGKTWVFTEADFTKLAAIRPHLTPSRSTAK